MAACCLAFLWISMSKSVHHHHLPSDTQCDKDCHLSIHDNSIDNRHNLQLLKVTIKQTKTDPFVWVKTSTSGPLAQPYAQSKDFSHILPCAITTRDHCSFWKLGNTSHANVSTVYWMSCRPSYRLTPANITSTTSASEQPPQQNRLISDSLIQLMGR